MAKKKSSKQKGAKTETQKVFVTNSGKRYDIIGEQGKFWLCEGHTFRKGSKLGHTEKSEIVVADTPEGADDEPLAEEATNPEESAEELDA